MYQFLIILVGKVTLAGLRLLGRDGAALPGLIVEKLSPSFTAKILGQLPIGVAVISGTNGKTTTTKIVTELLEADGLRVLTNPTGSNFGRGVTAALIQSISFSGRLQADVAVLELDEAHAVHFVKKVKPKYSLLLNVALDQVERFISLEHTTGLLQQIASATTGPVIVNYDDEQLRTIDAPEVVYFGKADQAQPGSDLPLVSLASFKSGSAKFIIDGREYPTELQLAGAYNAQNAAAALSLVKTIRPGADNQKLLKALSAVEPASGRGEKITRDGQTIELVLIKNAAGFQSVLESFPPADFVTMVAINNNHADGLDISWLKEVDFGSLKPDGVAVVSGMCAQQTASILERAEVPIDMAIEDLARALQQLLDQPGSKNKRIFASYTAMTELRRQLVK